MPITLNATAVPGPVVNTTLNLLSDAENATAINGANVWRTLVQGTFSLCAKWNRNALAAELMGRWGCGTYCIINGLAISTGSGLSLGVAAGQASIDGIVEIAAATTYVVPANQAYVGIWLKQDGTITHSLTTSVPTGGKVYLGSCVTGASSISSVDQSGVLYSRGAMAVRQTADAGIPGDTPSSSLVFVTITAGGTYLWNGSAYTLVLTNAQMVELIQDTAGAMMTNSTGITWTYSDAGATITAAFDLTAFTTSSLPEGSNLYFTNERVDDRIAALLAEGNGIDFTYDDGANTLTIAFDSLDQTVHNVDPVNAESISATKTLVITDKNVQALTASGANRDCRLPTATSLTFGHWFKIANVGASNDIVVKSNDGATTLVTLTPGQYCIIYPTTNAGTPAWPNSATAVGMGTPL